MAIYEKLLHIQQNLKAPKGQYNSFGKYSYRSCEDIVEAVKPLAGQEKAILTITDEVRLVGDRYYIVATATLTDTETGETVSTTAQAREEESKKGMDASQVSGAASSYARKYALNGLFAIDDTKDSDATNTGDNSSTAKKAPLCADCGAELKNIMKKDGALWSAEQIRQYSERRFGRCLCPACQKKAFAAEDGK